METLSQYMEVETRPVGMGYEEAKKWAELRIKCYHYGRRLTSMELFDTLPLLGDKRSRGMIIKHLQRLGYITPDGFTTRDQQGRNGGIAVSWKVIRDG